VHRDNRGTLWRVCLPCEALGEAPGDDVLLGRAAAPPSEPAPAPAPSQPARPSRPGPVSLLALAESLCRARGREGHEALDAAASEVADLLAEGHGPARIEASIRAVARKAGRAPQHLEAP
jgi:hypothetical protein